MMVSMFFQGAVGQQVTQYQVRVAQSEIIRNVDGYFLAALKKGREKTDPRPEVKRTFDVLQFMECMGPSRKCRGLVRA
ncbi:unnamed protein product [Symbiodinium microadriaticum]|nr:unnamed protein product [Symbiodinium microadriaticum]CAE7417310.1 unnamed protein product [Symbiodinium sp. KB8]